MRIINVSGVDYKLPNVLSKFQLKLYVHLINWKWKNITKVPGINYYKKIPIQYDAILPTSTFSSYPLIYPSILQDLLQHQQVYHFKLHQHFYHMASSQAANVNLFMPILLHPLVNSVLQIVKSDFDRLAVNELYKGFRIEFWDGNSNKEKGLFGDHNARSGTDSDIAIAYYNKENELCLWLIEHKLTEDEFTKCGGFKSNGRQTQHDCSKNFSQIISDKNICYYQDIRKFNYWNLTDKYQSFFVNHSNFNSCPFQGGLNQLWRNQLMGLALEQAGKYKHVYFSVVKHPGNKALDNSINEYKKMINNNQKFSVLESTDVLNAVQPINDVYLQTWSNWYKDLYNV